MIKSNSLKAFLIFFIFGVAVLGCQNTPSTSTQNETTSSTSKVYLTLAVEGMTCAGSEKTIQGALIAIDGVDSAFASHVDMKVKVFVDTTKVSLKNIQEAINAKGYEAGDFIK